MNPFPLHAAAAEGDHEKLKVLLMETVDDSDDESDSDQEYEEPKRKWKDVINKRDCRGLSALQIAVLGGHFCAAEVLLAEGATITRCSAKKRNLRPLHFCVLALATSSQNDCVTFLDLFLRSGADLFDTDRQKRTIFHISALLGAVTCLNFLAEYSKQKEEESEQTDFGFSGSILSNLLSQTDICGWTPLHCAAAGRKAHTTLQLLSLGSDIHAVDKEGNTPLHLTCKNGGLVVSSLLISKGASLMAQNQYNETPLQLAQRFGHQHLAQQLTQSPEPLNIDPELLVAWEKAEDLPQHSNPETRTSLLFDQTSLKHATYPYLSPLPHFFTPTPPPENSERLEVLVGEQGSLMSSEFDSVDKVLCNKPAPLADILRVHDYGYLRNLTDFCRRLSKPSEEQKNGIDCEVFDAGDTNVSYYSTLASLHAAGTVIEAVDRVCQHQSRNAFCAVRPPGHHAGPYGVDHICAPDKGNGFCLLNSVAIAASYARHVYRHQGIKRIAILDFDVHHGNGTEAIIECLHARKERTRFETKLFDQVMVEKWNCRPWLDSTDAENVFFVSVHGISEDLRSFFPGSGETTEEIEGEGENGGVINVGITHSRYSRYLWYQHWQKRLLPALNRFAPDLILFSAGFDAHALDEINGGLIGLFEEDYEWLTSRVQSIANQHCNGRVVSALEGGYAITGQRLSPFARSVAAHLRGLSTPGCSQYLEEDNYRYLPVDLSFFDYLKPTFHQTPSSPPIEERRSLRPRIKKEIAVSKGIAEDSQPSPFVHSGALEDHPPAFQVSDFHEQGDFFEGQSSEHLMVDNMPEESVGDEVEEFRSDEEKGDVMDILNLTGEHIEQEEIEMEELAEGVEEEVEGGEVESVEAEEERGEDFEEIDEGDVEGEGGDIEGEVEEDGRGSVEEEESGDVEEGDVGEEEGVAEGDVEDESGDMEGGDVEDEGEEGEDVEGVDGGDVVPVEGEDGGEGGQDDFAGEIGNGEIEVEVEGEVEGEGEGEVEGGEVEGEGDVEDEGDVELEGDVENGGEAEGEDIGMEEVEQEGDFDEDVGEEENEAQGVENHHEFGEEVVQEEPALELSENVGELGGEQIEDSQEEGAIEENLDEDIGDEVDVKESESQILSSGSVEADFLPSSSDLLSVSDVSGETAIGQFRKRARDSDGVLGLSDQIPQKRIRSSGAL